MYDLITPEAITGVGLALCSLRYWRRNELREPDPVLEEPVPEMPWGQATWDRWVSCPGGLLPGAELVDVTYFTGGREGFSATIMPAPGGRQTPDTIRAQAPHICAAYRLAPGSVDITPAGAVARIVVMLASEIYDSVPWPGPTFDPATGLARPGRYIDGAPSSLRFFTPGSGAKHWLVYGATGSGKTHFFNWVLAETTSAAARFVDRDGVDRQLFMHYLADGKLGQSFPEWIDSPGIEWAATTHLEILRMARVLRAELAWRTKHLSRLQWTDARGRTRRGLKDFDPAIACMPYVQAIFDELPLALKSYPEIGRLLLDVARGGRSVGIRLVLGAQSISAMELGSADLRGMITGNGNVIAFRTNDRNQKGMGFAEDLGGLNPSQLPTAHPETGVELQGMSILSGPDKRNAVHRTWDLPDVYDLVEVSQPVLVHPESRVAGGYDLAVWRWRVDDRLPMDVDPPEQLVAVPPPSGDLWPLLWLDPPAPEGVVPAAVVAVGAPDGPGQGPAVVVGLDGGTEDQQRRWQELIAAIGSGPTKRETIIERTPGHKMRTQTNDLAALAKRGLIHEVPGATRGVWAAGRGHVTAA